MDYWKQWSEMDSELLQQNLKYYQALLESIQESVDTRADSKKYTGTGDNKKYNPVKKSDGSVNHDWYLNLLKNGKSAYGGYYTYWEIITYVLPNIQIAIANKGKVESKQKDYVKTYEIDWNLYGITELQIKKTTYEDVIATLAEYELPFKDVKTDKSEPDYTKKYSEYWNAKNNLKTLEPVLKKLLQEQESLKTQIENTLSQREGMARQYLFSYIDNGKRIYNWDLTPAEYILIQKLIINTDYTNSNIVKTSVDTNITTIDREKELYDDSVGKLSEVSQPQYKFVVDLDNLLRIPEFEHWIPDLQLYKFIRLGIRDDYSVKLRIIGITYNPCEVTPTLTLEFSNMITSSSGRSDLTDILSSENNRGSKNSISLGASTDYDVDFATTLLQTMMKTGLFRNSISNVVGDLNITGEAVIDSAKIKQLFTDYVEAGEIKVGYISGEEAEFKKFYSQYGLFDTLVSEIISASTISVDKIIGKNGETFADLVNGTLNISKIVTEIITDKDGNNYMDMISGKLNMDTIMSNIITGKDGNSKYYINMLTGALNMDTIMTNIITGKDGNNKYYIDMVTGALNMSTIISNMAKLNEAEIGTLFTDTAFAKQITSISSTTAKSVIDVAYIKDVIANNVTAGDLKVGDILISDTMRILSQKDAKSGLVVNGSTMQFLGADGKAGIQIGYGTGKTPSIVIRDENGTALFTSTGSQVGVTAAAIADGIIVNDMISDKTLSKDKLNFSVIEPNDQGGIDITQVYDGKGNKWGVQYTAFTQNVSNSLTSLDEKIDESIPYQLTFTTTSGRDLRYGLNEKTTVTIHLYRNGEEVTDEYDDSHFIWDRVSADSSGDVYWNEQHTAGTKVLTITLDDFLMGADFNCYFIIDGEVLASLND